MPVKSITAYIACEKRYSVLLFLSSLSCIDNEGNCSVAWLINTGNPQSRANSTGRSLSTG